MPEQMIAKLNQRIPAQWKTCFWSALAVGLLAHLYKLTNWLPNWDSLVFRYDPQNMLGLGRWFLPVACGFSSFYDLPWLAGLLALVFHALGAVCICRMFAVQKKVTAALIGAMVVTFPTVTSVLMYNYVADGYALSFLLACGAACCLTQDKPRYPAAILLIALSVGIYQAYITVTVMLLLCWLIRQTLQTGVTAKTVLFQSGKLLVAGAIGMILYYLVLNLLLKVTGTQLIDYQGVKSAISLTELDWLGSLYAIKHSFLRFFFDPSGGLAAHHIINGAVFAVTILLYFCDAIKAKLNLPKWLMLALWVVLLPVGASLLAFINSGVDYHNLMKMGFCVFYLLFLLQYEQTQFQKEAFNRVKLWTILLTAVALVFSQTLIANISYHKLTMAYEKSYGILIRIADRIEQTDGAAECNRILVAGSLPQSAAYSADIALEMTGTTDGLILRADDETVAQSVFCSALNDYCGTNYRFVAGEEKTNLLEQIGADALGVWPERNAILVVDDVIVISLGRQP